jgi:hypothetical protein
MTNIIFRHEPVYPAFQLYSQYLLLKKGTMKKFLSIAFVSMLTPFICLAHEGHGSTNGFTITHYFIEPEHAIFTWSFLMAGFLLIGFYQVKKKRSSK